MEVEDEHNSVFGMIRGEDSDGAEAKNPTLGFEISFCALVSRLFATPFAHFMAGATFLVWVGGFLLILRHIWREAAAKHVDQVCQWKWKRGPTNRNEWLMDTENVLCMKWLTLTWLPTMLFITLLEARGKKVNQLMIQRSGKSVCVSVSITQSCPHMANDSAIIKKRQRDLDRDDARCILKFFHTPSFLWNR